MSPRDPRALRKILGDRPLVDPSSAEPEDAAWRRVAVKLAAEPPAPVRTSWWIGAAVAAGLAGATALLLLHANPPPSPAPQRAEPVALAPAPSPALQVPGAEVEGTNAAVSVSDGQRATLVNERQEIAQGSRVVTARGEAKLHFPGGSVTLLEPDSSVQLARLDPDNVEIELQSGAIFVHAVKLAQGQLAVRTGAYRVIVHGTGFRVERSHGQVEVGLWHGSVEVRADGASHGTMLEPGHRLSFSEAHGLAGLVIRSLGEGEERGVSEEARLLGLPAPAPKPAHRAPPAPTQVAEAAPSGPPAPVVADVARCRAETPSAAKTSAPVRLDLTLSDDGQVLSAAAEHGGDAKLASCVAEAALHWKLDPPPTALRGMQFVYAVPVGRPLGLGQ